MPPKASADLQAERERIYRALLRVPARLIVSLRGRRPNLDNSIRFDMADMLSPDFQKPIDALVKQIIDNSRLIRVGKSIQSQIQNAVSALAANLIRAHSLDPSCYVAISMGSQYYTASRYNCQEVGYVNLYRTVEYMRRCEPALISYHPGFQDRRTGYARSTRIQATNAFWDYFAVPTEMPPLFCIAQNPAFECIRLKDENKTLIEYDDTKTTEGMRQRLQKWNEFLNQQWTDLYVTDEEFKAIYDDVNSDDLEELKDNAEDENSPTYVDLTRNRLYRVFNNESFDQGGRFYGGWWQSIPSEWRQYVTINWHPTRELDYSNMQPAMLYAKCGLPLKEDAYALDGVDQSYRKLLKKTLFQLINAREDQRIRAPAPEALPPGFTWDKLQNALIKKHELIAKYLRTGIGIEFQRIDSDIAEEVMHSMMDRNMLVLPIHDSFLVRRGHYLALRDHMSRAYKERIGQDIGITLDLSFADKLGPGRIVSKFEEIFAILKEARTGPKGYEAYFERGRAYQLRQKRAWFLRFNPYQIFR